MKDIAAIATPPGEGAISIIKLSGDKVKSIGFSIVKIKDCEIFPNKLYFGEVDTGVIKDEVLIVWFKAPFSYTGEDVVEIHCHGSIGVTNEILRACIENGCCLAEAGEFTRRAFLNGKMDLTKAEGIIDIINAETVSQIKTAHESINGRLYLKIKSLQDKVIKLTAEAEAAVDYPEEDLEEKSQKEIEKNLEQIIAELKELTDTYREGRLIKNGVRIAIAGEPNVGKSMLLNSLLNSDRAIVSPKAGTTRDTIDESFSYKNMKFIITDTAGIRNTEDEIEILGIERSKKAMESADIVLAVTDGTSGFLTNGITDENKIIYVRNKCDLLDVSIYDGGQSNNNNFIYVSAKQGINIDRLKELIYEKSFGKISTAGITLSNVRHYNAAVRALSALIRAKNSLYEITLDCIISDLNESYRELGGITGITAADEIVNEIFARFCVGK